MTTPTKKMTPLELQLLMADNLLDMAHDTPLQDWSVDQYLQAAQVRALLAIAAALDSQEGAQSAIATVLMNGWVK